MTRKYTVAEIDDLRLVVGHLWVWGTFEFTSGASRSYVANEKEIAVEERIRTYMLGGVTADDIRVENAAVQAARHAWRTKAVIDAIIRKNIEGTA